MSQTETRNALTGNTAVEKFVQACAEFTHDHGVREVILNAQEHVFSSGGNFRDMQWYHIQKPTPDIIREEYRNGIQHLLNALYHLDVPGIVAVNGQAAGLDLACMCDIRIASERATFAESYLEIGVVPGDGGACLLPRAVGLPKACDMEFTGEALLAQEALACDLVSRVVPHDALMFEARRLAGMIAANPGVSSHDPRS